MHNLSLDDDQALILDTVRKYVQDAVAPTAQERDEHRQFARAELQGLGELGLFGLPVPESSGGVGMGLLPLAAAGCEIGLQSGSLARLLTTQVQCTVALAHAGSGGAIDELLAGTKIGAWVGLEHGIVCNQGRLTGAAELVPAGAEADVLVIAARDGAGVVLVTVAAAMTTRTPLRSLGFASAGPARVVFADTPAVAVSTGAVAAAAATAATTLGWISGAAACVGMGLAAVQLAKKHASERIAFGKPLLAQQAVVRKLVECQRHVDAARHLVFHAARVHDLGQDAEAAAAAARVAAVDAAVLAADESIQIHGGFGYVAEYHVERHYRDAMTTAVLDGGNDRLRDRLAALQFAS